MIFSDPKRIKQILFNLVGNAKKFTFKGAIKIYVRKKPMDDSSREIVPIEEELKENEPHFRGLNEEGPIILNN
eukprot:CAMPEP_0170554480 /NCGR_PEP_ID=MMETSP0211-20121228/12329_1 /TAXON_ID=311385 /ORGANISM="Pseudokeronopsis sp., Strain OXSARD2" /LENGTH=72 /DNA_ID=CAMNT_0010863557 /DNA_START=214 /DNA_END=432 /DNA_ORIENTATION=+